MAYEGEGNEVETEEEGNGNGGGLWAGLFTAIGNGIGNAFNNAGSSTSWDNQAHKDWVTQWVSQDGLDWMDTNRYGHRQGMFDASRQAWGEYLVMAGAMPNAGDPDYQRVVNHMVRFANDHPSAVPRDSQGNLVATRFIMVWPWQPGAFAVATWKHWGIWLIILGAGAFAGWKLWKGYKRRKRARKAARSPETRG